MVRTFGLTHIAIAVSDVKRAATFYGKLLGARLMYSSETFAQLQTPGARDIIVFEKNETLAGKNGGLMHFGFRMQNDNDIETAIRSINEAGGKVKETGEFVPGEPFVFFYDPDGYEVEIWFEKINAGSDFS